MMARLATLNSPPLAAGPLATVTFAVGLLLGAAIAGAMVERTTAPPAATARAQSGNGAGLAGQHADVLRVIDGDTFEARVSAWPGLDITTRVRLRGIDAPEMQGDCAQERAGAYTARESLRRILDEGSVSIREVGQDKYGGRVVARVATALTPDVSDALLRRGVVRLYSGGRRDSWC